jgi:hypothetical protein
VTLVVERRSPTPRVVGEGRRIGRGRPRSRPVLFTIGHSTLEGETFVSLLRRAGIRELADVRRYPGSRRNPQFGFAALEESLGAAGIAYSAFGAALGGRRQPVQGSVNDGWRVRQFQGYADHMASPEFSAGMARLATRARERRVAVMCAEADWRRCHRRLIADAALVHGFRVRHLLRDGAAEDHRLTEFAVRTGATLTYPAPPAIEPPPVGKAPHCFRARRVHTRVHGQRSRNQRLGW